jgi:amylovoran biosynthesis protein AmsC
MTMYFVIFFLLLCAVVAGFRAKASTINPSLYLLAAVAMIGCAGLRAESVGRDYGTYRIYFDGSPDQVGPGFFGQWSSTMPFVDIAYVYLNSLVKKVGLPFEALIFIVALVVVGLYAVFFWKHSRFSAIALMIYFSHAFLNTEMIQIRAGLASVISLWAFHFWASDRKRRGSALMLLAVMTHLAVIVAVIPLLIFHFQLIPKPKYVVLTMLLALLIGYNLSSSFALFSLAERLASFQDTEYSTSLGIFSNTVTLKQLVILGLLCWLMNSRHEKLLSPIFRLSMISYWTATLWIIAFSQFQILGARGASFLSFVEPFLVAEIVVVVCHDPFLRRYRRITAFTVVCFALSMLVLDLEVKEVVDNYQTVFQQSMVLPHREPGESMLAQTAYLTNSTNNGQETEQLTASLLRSRRPARLIFS